MSDTKSGSRSGSKTNLNESTLPLLDEEEKQEKGETPEKENIELKEKGSTGSGAEKDDSSPEKKEEKEGEEKTEAEGSEGKEKKEKKKKKEKKPKEPKEKKEKSHARAASCVQNLSVGLNLLDRDDKNINSEVNLNFEDVLAEPDASHGFDGLWQLTYIVFTGTKYWVYRLMSAVLALPFAILWGLIFSILTFLHIWLITPTLKVIDLVLDFVRRIWIGVIRTTVEPVAAGCGLFFSKIHVTKTESKALPTSVTMETV